MRGRRDSPRLEHPPQLDGRVLGVQPRRREDHRHHEVPSRPGETVRSLALGLLLAGWVLLADSRALQAFGSESACTAAATAWQRQARDGVRWVAKQRQAAQGQPDELFW